MADLCLLAEDGTVARRWTIGDQPAAVGRDEAADITIPDNTLSRQHFLIWREGDSFRIKDLNSENGTSVDGERVQEATLRNVVCVAAGRTLFIFRENGFLASPMPALSYVTAQRVASSTRIAAAPNAPAA
jgi:pSer/pThr/pTyr-binding forkhead associated (FHA) protein